MCASVLGRTYLAVAVIDLLVSQSLITKAHGWVVQRAEVQSNSSIWVVCRPASYIPCAGDDSKIEIAPIPRSHTAHQNSPIGPYRLGLKALDSRLFHWWCDQEALHMHPACTSQINVFLVRLNLSPVIKDPSARFYYPIRLFQHQNGVAHLMKRLQSR